MSVALEDTSGRLQSLMQQIKSILSFNDLRVIFKNWWCDSCSPFSCTANLSYAASIFR